jgi:hypothetical protein
MKVISKAFMLQGQEETPQETTRETKFSPSILRHHTELFRGSTITYGLESDIP